MFRARVFENPLSVIAASQSVACGAHGVGHYVGVVYGRDDSVFFSAPGAANFVSHDRLEFAQDVRHGGLCDLGLLPRGKGRRCRIP